MYYLGLDIGGTSVKYLIVDSQLKIVKEDSFQTNLDSKNDFLQTINHNLKLILNEFKIESIGIGFPGAVDTKTGKILSAVNLGFDTVNLKEEIKHQHKVNVFILNDANAAAYGEYASYPEIENLLFITLGTGLGGGIILDNNLLQGSNNSAGEIGHIPVRSDDNRICGCKNENCLETFVSRTGILKSFKEAELSIEYKDLDVVDIFDLYHKKEPKVVQIIDWTFSLLGQHLAGVVNTIDVDNIIIGGGISNAGSVLIDLIKPSLEKHLFPSLKNHVNLYISQLRNTAGALGAAAFARDNDKG